ncbi:Zinc finger, GRF-type [Sesbania bispinosa]|nr:Zinc finger, GRF-type [Sesbania bispinosa]
MMGGGGFEQPRVRHPKKPSTTSWSGFATSMDSAFASKGHGFRLCFCGNRAIVRMSKTQRNPGRPFFTCALSKDNELNCNFFAWVDGAGVGEEITAADSGRGLWNKTESLAKIDNVLSEVRIVKCCVFGIGCVIVGMLLVVILIYFESR